MTDVVKSKPLWAVVVLALIGLVGELTGVWEALIDWVRSEQHQEYYQLQRIDGEQISQVNEDASFAAVVNQTDTTNPITFRWFLKKPGGTFESLLDNNSFVSIDLPCSEYIPGNYAIKVETTLSDGSNLQEKSMQFRVDPYPREQNATSGWNINDPCANVRLPRNVVVGDGGLNIVASQVSAHIDGTHISAGHTMSARAADGENGSPGTSFDARAGRGHHGQNGGDGSDGQPGTPGVNAPNARIIATSLAGTFSFDLSGQNGGYGGAGGPGGKAQDGGNGKHGVSGAFDCNSGPQSGRNGGVGGSGGNGGVGGTGGNAGNVAIEVESLDGAFSIQAKLDGGIGGLGGSGGSAGAGGSGGARGSAPGNCSSGGRGNGSAGSAGQNGTDRSTSRAGNGDAGTCRITDQTGAVTPC